jgi:hypothetical protein
LHKARQGFVLLDRSWLLSVRSVGRTANVAIVA